MSLMAAPSWSKGSVVHADGVGADQQLARPGHRLAGLLDGVRLRGVLRAERDPAHGVRPGGQDGRKASRAGRR
jgi:hypothetical protein